ncbi:type IIL restriction-modification enzyme MmeI [Microcoleus sp. Pol10D4]|uniref:type IIL restriction-modification enzyme MmeI n=2 Tax=unclassified Microcoleus TaxID=2642155 RepID=UPI002FCF81E0
MNEGFKCLKANGSYPETMPPNLRADHATPKKSLHDRNDEILERIYIGRRFKNDTERLEKLFELYTKMTSQPALPKKSAKPKGCK